MKKSTIITLVVAIFIVGWTWSSYNGFITAHEAVDGSWAQVETQYQRRIDLIPNLVSTVKGAAAFEKDTFVEVTEARTKWMNAGTRTEQVSAANGMEGALARLMLTFENYPTLQATQAYRDLMIQLEGTENRIAVSRRDYNDIVRTYNVRVKRFPAVVLAGLFGFGPEEFFAAEEGAEDAPDVNFE
ncbi:MAG: LemA family protein [Candidatus Peribacteraceae bacterium]|jgi:LemA protein|nr:LemA family protein [Candidatus Peribacteraceae bacterium]|tara:strand:- start:13212 stop:13769 length:558 start_codon:yes stop_codon:yes gene_type:complete